MKLSCPASAWKPIRAALLPYDTSSDEEFTEAARKIYIELSDCLEANEPWAGRRG